MTLHRALMLFTACTAVSMLSPNARAQTQVGIGAAPAADAAPIQDVIVTGSRVARPNLVSPNPVTQLSAEDIAQTGLQSTGQILNQLPQTSNTQVGENNNRYVNGAGLQAINLRGLGAYRTLTLVDGRRHVGSLSGVNNSGGTSEVDTAIIPPLLIDHIDVVTGGSSAAYGADAVAGVVNFVMKKNYEGGEITVQQGQATEGGQSTFNVDAIIGTNFADNRGNITVAADFQNQAAIRSDQRDYATNQTIWGTNPTGGQPDFVTYHNVRSSVYAADYAPTIATSLPGHKAFSQVLLPDGSGLTGFDRGTAVPGVANVSQGNADGYNVTNFRNLQPPNNRKIIDTIINYKIAEDVGPINDINFFADLKYADSRGGPFANGTQTTPTSLSASIPIPVTNAYIPADLANQLRGYTGSVLGAVPGSIASLYNNNYAGPTFAIRKITADWALRTSQYEYQYYRSVVGFDGHIFDRFKYEVYYDYGQNTTDFLNNDRLTQNLTNAFDTVSVGGVVRCASSIAFPSNGCVPVNPFRVGPLTQAQYNYLYTTTHEHDQLAQHDWAANVNGDLLHYATPFSGVVAPLGIAFGGEYREEDTNSQPDPLQKAVPGTIAGNNAGTRDTVGGFKTREFYAEANVPILRELPFAKAVDFDGAIRFQSYTTTGDDFTWNARGTWAVTDDFKIRGGFAKAVRAPNGDELYSSGGQSFIQIADPCGGVNGANRAFGNAATRAITCAGVPLYTVLNSASSSNISGNPNLTAETSQNAQIGGVFTPRFIPGLTASVDYFSFLIKNSITTTDANTVVDQCYDKNVSSYCSFLSRNGDGSLNVVQTPYVNAGKESLKGVDFSLNYILPLSDYGVRPFGDDAILDFGFDASWIINHTLILDKNNPSTSQYLAGSLGFPRVKANIKIGYSGGPFAISAVTRYVGEQNINVVGDGLPTYDNNQVAPQVYEDIYIRYNWKRFAFFAGINNLFDIKPPLYPTVYSGGNYPDGNSAAPQNGQANAILDNTGRYVFGGVTVKF